MNRQLRPLCLCDVSSSSLPLHLFIYNTLCLHQRSSILPAPLQLSPLNSAPLVCLSSASLSPPSSHSTAPLQCRHTLPSQSCVQKSRRTGSLLIIALNFIRFLSSEGSHWSHMSPRLDGFIDDTPTCRQTLTLNFHVFLHNCSSRESVYIKMPC